MMEALLSGATGMGVLWDQQRTLLIDLKRPGQVETVSTDHIARLLRGREGGLRRFFIQAVEEAFDHLRLLYRQRMALDLILFALDGELSRELRRKNLLEVERSYQSPAILDYVSHVLHAQPMPTGVLLTDAVAMAHHDGAVHVHTMLAEVLAHQTAIAQARAAWDALPDPLFPHPVQQERPVFRQTAVENGLFRAFAQTVFSGKSPGAFQFQALQALHELPRHKELVQTWAGYLPREQKSLPKIESERRKREPVEPRTKTRGGYDRVKQFQNTTKLKDQIIALFDRQPVNEHKVEQLLARLRDLQEEKNRDDLAKSLTDLAVRAREAGLSDYYLQLSQEAVDHSPTDGFAWSVLAAAQRLHGHYDEALMACQRADEFGKRLAAWVEQAETLVALNRLDEALALRDRTVTEFPDNVVARTGRAETLKSLNRLEEALTAYDEIVAAFPENVVARSGRAETLKSLNRLEEALDSYEAIVAAFPSDVVARNGRAETLKSLNRLEEALDSYEAIVAAFPSDVVARTGRAETLKSLNRTKEALDSYEAIVAAFPENVVARTGRAETLKSLNRPEEALTAYREIRRLFPKDQFARNGEAGVLLAMGLVDEAMELLAEISHPVTHTDWIAWHIRGRFHLYQGQLPEAERVFQQGVAQAPPRNVDYFHHGLAATHMRMRAFSQAEAELAAIATPALKPAVTLLRVHLGGLSGAMDNLPALFAELKALGMIYCGGVAIKLERCFLEGQSMNDEELFKEIVACMPLAA